MVLDNEYMIKFINDLLITGNIDRIEAQNLADTLRFQYKFIDKYNKMKRSNRQLHYDNNLLHKEILTLQKGIDTEKSNTKLIQENTKLKQENTKLKYENNKLKQQITYTQLNAYNKATQSNKAYEYLDKVLSNKLRNTLCRELLRNKCISSKDELHDIFNELICFIVSNEDINNITGVGKKLNIEYKKIREDLMIIINNQSIIMEQ